MTRSVTALRLYGPKDIRIDQIPAQICRDNELRIEVAYCGICGSDLHEFAQPVLCPQPGSIHPLTGCSLPVTLGHEISGQVIEIGSKVTSFGIGDRVVLNPAITERHVDLPPCEDCALGHPNICARASNYGLGGPAGGFADEIVVKAFSAIKLPAEISLEEAALVEPLAVAWHSVRTAGFQRGQDALVLGAGPIGLAILQVLRVWGARNIIVSDVLTVRKAQASVLGATLVVDPVHGSVPLLDSVHSVCARRGVDVAFDATGLQSTLDDAIAAVKPRGTIFNVAIHERPLLLNPTRLSLQEKIYRGGNGYTHKDFSSVIAAMAKGELQARPMITAIEALEDVIEKGFHELLARKGDHVKILIRSAAAHKRACASRS